MATKLKSNQKQIREDVIFNAYLTLNNEHDFYKKVYGEIKKNGNKIITLAKFDSLVKQGFNQYVKHYSRTEQSLFDNKAIRIVSKQLRDGFKEEIEFAKKYKH